MTARTLSLLLATTTLLGAPATAGAATYKGEATNVAGDFRYGKVTVKTKGNRITRIEVESVTTTGCGGFMTVVFADGYEGSRIVKGSNRIRDGRFSFVYQPTTDVEDQVTRFRGRISASRVTGRFKSGELCSNAGRFRATR